MLKQISKKCQKMTKHFISGSHFNLGQSHTCVEYAFEPITVAGADCYFTCFLYRLHAYCYV